ncbi:MAG: CHAT domain-containing protein [Bacteroidota bacterium]
MKSIGLTLLISISFTVSTLQAQVTADDFTNKYTEVYLNISDTAKAKNYAMEAFAMLETNEALQEPGNYFILKSIFENAFKDEEMAGRCEKRANALMTFDSQVQKPASYNTPLLEWTYEYQLEFHKRRDIAFGRAALKFLNNHEELWNYTNFSSLGQYFESTGNFQKAAELFERGYELLGKDPNEVVSLITYASFLFKSGDYQKVEELVVKNDELLKSANQYTSLAYELSGQMIRMLYSLNIGDYISYIKASDSYYEFYQKQQNVDLGYDPYAQARLSNRAWGEESSGQWEKASKSWQLADSAWKAANAKLLETYPNMPTYYYSMSALFEARIGGKVDRQTAIEEIDTYYMSLSKSAPNFETENFSRGQQYGFLKDARYHQQFEAVLRQLPKKRDFTEATLPLASYAYFLMRDGNLEKSFQTYRTLFKENIEWINDIIFTFGEKAFVAYYTSKIKEGYDNFHSFVKHTKDADDQLYPKAAEIAYDNTLLTKSMAFKGVRKRKKAFLLSNSEEIKNVYNQWIAKKQDLMRMYQIFQTSQTRDKNLSIPETTYSINEDSLEVLQQEVDLLENKLANEAKDFKSTLQVNTPDWKKTRNNLKPGEAAIEMVRFRLRDQVYYSDSIYYAAYIVKHDSKWPEVVYLPEFDKRLESAAISQYKNAIRYQLKDNHSYNDFWRPIGEKLEGIKRVFFSPDGIYHLISLPTLQNPETGSYLLDEIDIQNVTSTRYVGSTEKISVKTSTLFGRPSYKIDGRSGEKTTTNQRSFVQNFKGADVADLPGTKEEVVAIEEILKANNISPRSFLGNEASENKFYQLDNPDILHIATHGYWSENEGAVSAGYQVFNALVNSGLLLSGVVDYYQAPEPAFTNDGILTAYEAQNLNLENTDLVVLSACETGLGNVSAGEGVYGLQRAFRTAGAKSSITSLWKVDDEGTRDFMITFYKKLTETKDIRSSFHFTQQEIKKKYQTPYYWGAFVLIGN